ncbi:glycerophosphodiester phosphodiesterase [bacterium]|jgi:glycerophosphoryl diester phosphodiesterase|nr:glycerophosphodiester phosphodiesterase [bacterium]
MKRGITYSFLFWAVFLSCLYMQGNPMILIGHRGAAAVEPENTLISFEHAIRKGVDMIELDVHQCASGQLVVIHDYTVDRTTNGSGYVSNLTLDQIKMLDADKGQKIPTLIEALDFIDRRCKVNIELKGKHTANLVAQTIIHYVETKGWSYDYFVVSSLDRFEILHFNSFLPVVPTGAIVENILVPMIKKLPFKYLIIDKKNVTEDIVNVAHENNKFVLVYTVNDPEDVEALEYLEVDGIFTDSP